MRKHYLLLPLLVLMCGCGDITVEFSGENGTVENGTVENGESSPSDGLTDNIIVYESVDGLPITSFRNAKAHEYIFGERSYYNSAVGAEMEAFGANYVEDKENSEKREMVFNGKVTLVGARAFEGCKKLMKMTLPKSVELIDNSAFYSCEKLISIDLPSEMKKIGEAAFQVCKNLTEINLPAGLNEIGARAFAQTGLRKIELKSQINAVEEGAFQWCDQLTEVIMAEGLKWIGVNAFLDCQYLSEVTLPESITEIGNNAFAGCSPDMIMYVKAVAPPRIPAQSSSAGYSGSYSGLFYYGSYSRVTIYVPAEAIDAYRNSNWSVYNLVEYDFNAESNEE